MNAQRFVQPVSIFVGVGFPRDIETVTEAFQLLIEWHGSRDMSHAMALDACRAASAGEIDAAAARLAFEEFARTRGILAPDALAEIAQRAAEEWLAA